MKTYGGMEVWLYALLTVAQMEVSCQFHAPAASSPERSPWVGPRAIWTQWQREKFPACAGNLSRTMWVGCDTDHQKSLCSFTSPWTKTLVNHWSRPLIPNQCSAKPILKYFASNKVSRTAVRQLVMFLNMELFAWNTKTCVLFLNALELPSAIEVSLFQVSFL
jgi:hypothetical protein